MNKKHEPTIAPGNNKALEQSATKEEIAKGDYTEVTQLSYDEVWNTEHEIKEVKDGDK